MELIGSEIAKMHKADIIHGDLTTSNMIIRHPFATKGVSSTKLVRGSFAHRCSLPVNGALGTYRLWARLCIFPGRRQSGGPLRARAGICVHASRLGTNVLLSSRSLQEGNG